MTPSRPAAEQKALGGVGSLVRDLFLPSNMVPIETRHNNNKAHVNNMTTHYFVWWHR